MRTTKIIRFISLSLWLVALTACEHPAETQLDRLTHESELMHATDKNQEWLDRLPVSLNGRVPFDLIRIGDSGVDTDFVNKFWHDGGNSMHRNEASINPNNFFEDESHQALCKAICRIDLDEMKRLIDSGMDLNKSKYENYSLLYFAFNVDEDIRPFELLLKSGADPNRSGRMVTPSVSNLVAMSRYNRAFELVFEHGGDPNGVSEGIDRLPPITPFYSAVMRTCVDSIERIELLLKKGAKVDEIGPIKGSDLIIGCLQNVRSDPPCSELDCEKALVLLKAGASFSGRQETVESDPFFGFHIRPIHLLAFYEDEVSQRPAAEQVHYEKLLLWLIEHDESLEKARSDLQTWEAQRASQKKPSIKELDQKRRAAYDQNKAYERALRDKAESEKRQRAAEEK